MKNCGAVNMSTLINGVMVILNIALNAVFIFGLSGFPNDWGLKVLHWQPYLQQLCSSCGVLVMYCAMDPQSRAWNQSQKL